MGYEVKQYKLTAMDAHSINSARPPNWFAAVKVGDEFPMILMGKVLLDGEYFHWVDPNAVEPPVSPPVPAMGSAAVTPSVVAVVPVSPVVTPVPVPVVAPASVALTAEQHAALSALGIPA